MSDPLDPNALDHLAALARLRVSPAARARLGEDLAGMLRTLAEVAASTIDAADDSLPLAAAPAAGLRPDEVRASLSCEEALANAPARLGDGFAVPAMLAAPKGSADQESR